MSEADRALLTHLFEVAVQAADPLHAIAPHLPDPPNGRTIVIGAGKGVAQMAAAFERLWPHPCNGVVVTRYGYSCATEKIAVREASHPVPDKAGLDAAQEIVRSVQGLTEDDLVIALICGGGSSLLAAPAPGLTLEDEQHLNTALLTSGAPISVMNTIRKAFSTLKGGRLALEASPARVVSLIVSDVPGDNPAEVASGPTVASAGRIADAKTLIELYGVPLPLRLRDFLNIAPEPPRPSDPAFDKNSVHVIASSRASLDAAAAEAWANGVHPLVLSDAIEGEAADVGQVLGALAREFATNNTTFEKPLLLLSGGETSVTLGGSSGRGGRNTECLLAFARVIDGLGVTGLMADTDGIDGSENNAGAFADGTTWHRLLTSGVSPLAALKSHDTWGAFNSIGDLFIPGPTGTNVNDFRAILIR